MNSKFELGQVLATIAILEFCRQGIDLGPLIDRHGAGDWGDVDDSVRKANETALQNGGALRSMFHPLGRRIWITTSADRKRTVIRFPADPANG